MLRLQALAAAVDAVEMAYSLVNGAPNLWTSTVARSLKPFLDEGMGILGWCYDASDLSDLKFTDISTFDLNPELLGAIARATLDTRNTLELKRRHYLTPAGSLIASAGDNSPLLNTIWQDHVGPLGVGDLLCLNALNFGMRGCAFSAPRRVRGELDTVRDALLGRVVAHLAAAHRLLKDRGTNALAGVEAVLTPNGDIEHAEGKAKTKEARSALARAVQSAELARGKMRRAEPVEALSIWKSMVDGRWTLTDQFERDGKRFVVARVNEPAPKGISSLSRKESQVLSFAGLGHSNKLIAYELGVKEGTVARELARAQHKLGAKSIADLVALACPALATKRPV